MYYITDVDGMQVQITDNGEIFTLHDSRFAWKERKMKTAALARLYEKAGYPEYAGRVASCATWLQYDVFVLDGSKKLSAANFCQLRLCPMCSARRSRKMAVKLSQVLTLVEEGHQAKFVFLTLTMRSVPGEQLGAALEQLVKAWNRLLKQRQMERSIKGWYRAIEITRSGMEYHPHIHAILAVDQDYFSHESRESGRYLNQSDLIVRWQKALRADYLPSVDIRVTREKNGTGSVLASGYGKAVLEAGKYTVKDVDYIDPELPEEAAVNILKDYTTALRRRRLTAFGGWMKETAKILDADNLEEDQDLVHVDDDLIRDDIADLIETYGWHFGVGDYILAKREINPLKVPVHFPAFERQNCKVKPVE